MWTNLRVNNAIRTPKTRWVSDMIAHNSIITGALAGSNYPSANLAFFIPFTLDSDESIIDKLMYSTGSPIGASPPANIDIGIYDSAFNRLQADGGSAISTAGQEVVEVDISNITAGAGDYYIAFVTDGTDPITRLVASQSGIQHNTTFGILEQASAYPLPATAAPSENASRSYIPMIGFKLA